MRTRRHVDGTEPRSLTRREAIIGIGGTGAAALGLGARPHSAAAQADDPPEQIHPFAGRWRTWVLESGDQLRPDPPPSDDEDLARLNEWYGRGTPSSTPPGMMMHWNAGSPGYRWNQVATRYALDAELTVGRAYRAMALLNVAIHDATIAVWDAKFHYNRARPVDLHPNPLVGAYLPAPNFPSYPSVHAATAGAAETVLAHLFPDERAELKALADEAAMLLASCKVEFLSDVEVGRAMGEQVGELVLAWAAEDNADATFDPDSLPTGEGLWTGEPEEPTLGDWKPWVLSRPTTVYVPPPDLTPVTQEEALQAVRSALEDAPPSTGLTFWPDDPFGRPEPEMEPDWRHQAVFHYARAAHLQWVPELAQKLTEYRLDTDPPWASRAYAMVSVAVYDATVAAWHQKFRHMAPRPDQLDPSIIPLLPTPATPAYPSAHAAAFGAVAEVLGSLFGWDAGYHFSRAFEGAASRVWAGVNVASATNAGWALGREVGARVIRYVSSDRARNSAHPMAILPYVDPACR